MTETTLTAPALAASEGPLRDEIRAALREEFAHENVNQVARLVKVVVNMGVGEAARDSKLIEGAIRDLTAITGQKPQVTKARKSIAQFKLREGMPIGAHVTLRGDRMWEFLDRLLSIALPRIRDFRGLSPKQFDGHGNYTFGLDGAVDVPRDRPGQDRPGPRHGHHRRDDRDHRRRGPRAAQASSASPSRRTDMAKTALDQQGRRASRSSRCAATPGASGAVVRTRCTASSACAGSACARWRTAASSPASPRAAGNNHYERR